MAIGADWTRRNRIWERLQKHGVAQIHKEIQKLWDAIILRTDVITEYEILTSQIEREKSHDGNTSDKKTVR